MSDAPELEAIGLYFDKDAYVEPTTTGEPSRTRPMGLMGRHVAGQQFLEAFWRSSHVGWVVGLTSSAPSLEAFRATVGALMASGGRERRVEAIEEQRFHAAFLPKPPVPLLHFPFPPPARHAWVRQHSGGNGHALTGVTHTLASPAAVQALNELVTAPFEPYDALICTSRSVLAMVRSVTGAYADHLRERHGGRPTVRARLEHIPLGVDTEKHRPATPEERAAVRKRLDVAEDEIVVLFVGRLAFHAKAQPFPMFDGVARAARAAGCKAHLILSGWAPNEAIGKAFRDGARVFAPSIRTTFVNGMDPGLRSDIWHAADVFTLLTDNIQETFGLVIAEAMASGLPVVASDWDGCRDQVIDGETGFLVPTTLMRGAASNATSRLILGELNYDHFLGECSQAACVDPLAAAEAFRRLFADADLRHRFGAAGRQRAVERFAWPGIIRDYERLWQEQNAERVRCAAHRETTRRPNPGPACYPAPEASFASYPTALLDGHSRLVADKFARERLNWFTELALTNYGVGGRTKDPEVIRAVLAAAAIPRTIAELDEVAGRGSPSPATGRGTLAWLLKYGMLHVAGAASLNADASDGAPAG